MQIKAVIFDLDGTLLDSIEDIADAGNTMLRINGYSGYPVSKYIEWIGEGARKLVARTIPDGTNEKKELLDKRLKQFRDIYEDKIAVKTRIYDGIPDLLDFLNKNNIPISILSNKPHYLTEKLHALLLKDHGIKIVFGQRDDVPRKPDPAAAIEIAAMIKTAPGNILFVGDSPVDLQTAKAAGMIPLGVTWGYNSESILKKAGYKHLVNKPTEIMEFISLNNMQD